MAAPFPGYLNCSSLGLSSWVLDLGAGRRCPLRFSGEAPQDVDRARFVALGLAAAALLVINRVVALIVGLVRADRN